MAKYYYSNTAIETTLAGNVTSSATTLTVTAATGFPVSFPYVVAVGYGATDEELVKVTGASGTALTVERGFGGTSAQSHSLGATVRHVYNAQDATDFRTHEVTGEDTHGVTGEIVGTGDTQTLANKTLTSPVITDPSISGGGAMSGTFTGAPVFDGLGIKDISLTRSTSGFLSVGDTAFQSERASASDESYTSLVVGDSFNRFEEAADGSMSWGDGSSARDVKLSRFDDAALGTGLATSSPFLFTRPSANHDIIDARVEDDEGIRFALEANGRLLWGDGASTTVDCSLFRSDPDRMQMNAKFSASVETSKSFTTASGFSLYYANHRKTCGVCTIEVYAQVTRTINTTSSTTSNIDDEPLGTIPDGFRPPFPISTIWSTGIESGSAEITDDGVIMLRTSDYAADINAGSNLRLSATYVL